MQPLRVPGPLRAPAMVAALTLVALLATGCSRDMAVANDPTVPPAVSPVVISSMPNDIEAVSVAITGGRFGVDRIELLEDAPTVLHLENGDDTAYRLQIVPALVNPTPIPAKATTVVSFTTPNAAEFAGQLLGADSAEVLDTVRVVVRSPGAVAP
jgi:hypothetical protein